MIPGTTTCMDVVQCLESTVDGGGGTDTSWQTGVECDPPVVDCDLAQEGDLCMTVGDSCCFGSRDAIETVCQPDHTWAEGEFCHDG